MPALCGRPRARVKRVNAKPLYLGSQMSWAETAIVSATRQTLSGRRFSASTAGCAVELSTTTPILAPNGEPGYRRERPFAARSDPILWHVMAASPNGIPDACHIHPGAADEDIHKPELEPAQSARDAGSCNLSLDRTVPTITFRCSLIVPSTSRSDFCCASSKSSASPAPRLSRLSSRTMSFRR